MKAKGAVEGIDVLGYVSGVNVGIGAGRYHRPLLVVDAGGGEGPDFGVIDVELRLHETDSSYFYGDGGSGRYGGPDDAGGRHGGGCNDVESVGGVPCSHVHPTDDAEHASISSHSHRVSLKIGFDWGAATQRLSPSSYYVILSFVNPKLRKPPI